ncbi:MAG TPA: peptidylprolyl isomerase, partial [Alphaproteobacteria bacterium]
GKGVSAAQIEKIMPQVLESLIAETVQLQEMRRQGVVISDADIQGGIAKIAENNKMAPEQFLAILKKQGIPMHSIEQQIKAQLGWGKVIQQVIRPRVIVGDSEIQAERARMAASSGKREFYTAEIFLPVAKSEDDAKVRALAQTLAGEIRKGKSFPEVARQNSQSASAAQGGMIGWVSEGQLEAPLNAALLNAKPETVSEPIKGADGYYLLFVRDVRSSDVATPGDAVLTLKELVIDGTGMRERDAKAEAERIAKDLTGCLDIVKVAASDKRYKLGERKASLNELTATEKAAFAKLDIGQAAPPEISGNRAIITMICARDEPKGSVATDAALERKIGIQRLDMLQKRYLRDLISSAYIERRV